MYAKKEKTEFNKLQKRLRRLTGQAIVDYGMIEPNDKVMVCLSGGKDSYTLLEMLRSLQQSAPIDFELVAVNLDQKQPDFPQHVLPNYLTEQGVLFHIIEEDTYSVVMDKVEPGKTMCSLCSRLRRGILYRVANDIGATKVALGHHREDIIETFFLNLFYGGSLKSMPAKLISDDRKNILIRPLAYCKESDISAYAQHMQFPIIPCNLCGSQDNMQRQVIKELLKSWDKSHPGRVETIFNALSNIKLSHLMDREQFDFMRLTLSGLPTSRIPAMMLEE
jgi:tRNA 2-thiocytidine biosynthesis protein TtcA